MRADYMMMYSYNRERSLFITHAYGLSTEVWQCPIITRFSELRIIRKNGYEYHNTGFRLFENHCNFAATLDLQRQTETEIEMINLQ